MELRDDAIVLRRWRLDDAPAVTAACQDPEIPRWIPIIPRPYTEEHARGWLERCVSGEEGEAFAITDAATGDVLGAITMKVNDYTRNGHIGYWLKKEARGRGTAPRALRLVCEYGARALGLGRLELMTDPDNVASQRVAEKVGFQREGVLRSHLPHPDGRRRDSVMFSLLPDEL